MNLRSLITGFLLSSSVAFATNSSCSIPSGGLDVSFFGTLQLGLFPDVLPQPLRPGRPPSELGRAPVYMMLTTVQADAHLALTASFRLSRVVNTAAVIPSTDNANVHPVGEELIVLFRVREILNHSVWKCLPVVIIMNRVRFAGRRRTPKIERGWQSLRV